MDITPTEARAARDDAWAADLRIAARDAVTAAAESYRAADGAWDAAFDAGVAAGLSALDAIVSAHAAQDAAWAVYNTAPLR